MTSRGERLPALAVFTAVAAGAACLSPLWANNPAPVASALLFAGAAAEVVQGFRRRTPAAQRDAWKSGGVTLLLGLLVSYAAWMAAAVVAAVVAVPFALDALRYVRVAARQVAAGQPWLKASAAAVGNLTVGAGVLLIGQYASSWVIAIAAGLRLAGTTVNLAAAPVYSEGDVDENVIADMGIDHPERLAETGVALQTQETNRAAADRDWIAALILVLLAVHVSRMGFDRTALGILSPLVAVAGDVVIALVLAYAVIIPLRLFIRRVTRGLERRAWNWVLDPSTAVVESFRGWPRLAVRLWLERRLRLSIRLRTARFSMGSALSRGLQTGLPLAAVIVASVPIWGMSWYFDTENWAAGMWNAWAAERTDVWRSAMVRAVVGAGEATLDGSGFAVSPPGLDGSQPFSFVVIGDTGEGDASQHVLRDQLIAASEADDVRFVVLSSDVVYPSGAMKDYESRFWLPFKGVTKPVYAIPGNHDWYDALEGFVATFFTPEAARIAIRARIEADAGLSSTTDRTIQDYVNRADHLRRQYGVSTGFQQAPFFQVQTPGFALLAIDTGVLRTIDADERAWLGAALEASRGKMVMAILGHPFVAGGRDVSDGDASFTAIRALLREHDVRVIMAGDTHDLEYYREPVTGPSGPVTVHHWVNGGGGAYMSFGTALDFPDPPVTPEWAYYPSRREVTAKIEQFSPWWKRPAWIWTRELGAWPSSPEWLSAMFDYNVAPFFQSFVVVSIDPGARRITIAPRGVHGPLTWEQFDRSGGLIPVGVAADQAVEWVIEFDR